MNNIQCPICNKKLIGRSLYYICNLNKHIYVKFVGYETWKIDKFIFYNFYHEPSKKVLYLYRIESDFTDDDFYDLNPYEPGWQELPIRIEPTNDIEKIKGILLFT